MSEVQGYYPEWVTGCEPEIKQIAPDFWQLGPYTVKDSKIPVVFVDYFGGRVNYDEIDGISFQPERTGLPTVGILSSEKDRFDRRSPCGSGMSASGCVNQNLTELDGNNRELLYKDGRDLYPLIDLKKVPIEEVLQPSEAVQRLSPNLARVRLPNSAEELSQYTVLVRVENNKLAGVSKPVPPHIQGKIVPGTSFELTNQPSDFSDVLDDDVVPTLVVQTPFIEFQIEEFAGGHIKKDSQRIIREIPESLVLPPFDEPFRDHNSGLVLNGPNSSEDIANVTNLEGIPIQKLEGWLLPKEARKTVLEYGGQTCEIPDIEYDTSCSFLLPGEHFTQVWAQMNDTVCAAGLDHKDLATPLAYIVQLIRQGWLPNQSELPYRGMKLAVRYNRSRGCVYSPFVKNDDSGSAPWKVGNTDISVANQDNGVVLKFSDMTPYIGLRFGLWMDIGQGPIYVKKIDPQTIIDLFELNRPSLNSGTGANHKKE